jgi:hypothetical protein
VNACKGRKEGATGLSWTHTFESMARPCHTCVAERTGVHGEERDKRWKAIEKEKQPVEKGRALTTSEESCGVRPLGSVM